MPGQQRLVNVEQPHASASEGDMSRAAGNWDATVLLLSGASTMGKSHYARRILGPEYAAISVCIDDLYTQAVTEANLLQADDGRSLSERQRVARRHARDRKWASAAGKDAFFAIYEAELRKVLATARDAHSAVVLEGGSLMKEDEIALVARCADEILGRGVRLVRITIQVPYKRWLQNRVSRMDKAKVDSAPIRKLTEKAYKAEVKRAIPKPHERLLEHTVQSPKEMRRLMAELDRDKAV